MPFFKSKDPKKIDESVLNSWNMSADGEDEKLVYETIYSEPVKKLELSDEVKDDIRKSMMTMNSEMEALNIKLSRNEFVRLAVVNASSLSSTKDIDEDIIADFCESEMEALFSASGKPNITPDKNIFDTSYQDDTKEGPNDFVSNNTSLETIPEPILGANQSLSLNEESKASIRKSIQELINLNLGLSPKDFLNLVIENVTSTFQDVNIDQITEFYSNEISILDNPCGKITGTQTKPAPLNERFQNVIRQKILEVKALKLGINREAFVFLCIEVSMTAENASCFETKDIQEFCRSEIERMFPRSKSPNPRSRAGSPTDRSRTGSASEPAKLSFISRILGRK